MCRDFSTAFFWAPVDGSEVFDNADGCLLLAQSGHCHRAERCPLLGVKRTSVEGASMSAFDPKRTFGLLYMRTTQAPLP
jgi:hypothetical protein